MFALLPLCVHGAVGASTSSDPREDVSVFLETNELDILLETQLFERLRDADDLSDRLDLARRLSQIYLDVLQDPGVPSEIHDLARAKSAVLVQTMPKDALLDLRLEIAASSYNAIESRAELERVGLLDDQSRIDAVQILTRLERELFEIATTAQRLYSVKSRSRARTEADADEIESLLAVRSRAFYTLGWSGYALAVLNRSMVPDPVFARFGWILGFNGSTPILEDIDFDLLEFDHVARAALGIAQSRVQNKEYASARVWFRAVLDRAQTPEAVGRLAQLRLAETYAYEMNWLESIRFTQSLIRDDRMNTPSARVMVTSALASLAEQTAKSGQGGTEGAQELSRLLMQHLIDSEQFEHILDLANRFDVSGFLGNGFLSSYSEGLRLYQAAQSQNEIDLYLDAAAQFQLAITSAEASKYVKYTQNATLKRTAALLKADQPERARGSLESVLTSSIDPYREEVLWLLILSTDQAIKQGSGASVNALQDRLSFVIESYVRAYPSSDRTRTLVIRYASQIELPSDVVIPLLRADQSDPAQNLRARRTLVRYQLRSESFDQNSIQGDLKWILDNQNSLALDLNDARDRLQLSRVVMNTHFGDTPLDSKIIDPMISDALRMINAFSELSTHEGEFHLRRIQFMLADKRVVQASAYESSNAELLGQLHETAQRLIYHAAWSSFSKNRTVEFANMILRYGQPLISMIEVREDQSLTRDQSILCEQVASAASMLAQTNQDPSMQAVALGLSTRVFEFGDPSVPGLVLTAELAEQGGMPDTAARAWTTIVNAVPFRSSIWGRARYESFRIMLEQNDQNTREAFKQYVVLYPQGAEDPWGARIQELVEQSGVVVP